MDQYQDTDFTEQDVSSLCVNFMASLKWFEKYKQKNNRNIYNLKGRKTCPYSQAWSP